MQVERFEHPSDFLERAGSFLTSEEARHNLILGIASTLVADPDAYAAFELLTVAEDDRCLVASVRTPPYNVILSDAEDNGALDTLVDAFAPSAAEIPGVIGNRPTVDAFVERWRSTNGTGAKVQMRQGVFEARSVRQVPKAPGVATRASLDDRQVVAPWLEAFEAEALPDSGFDEEPSQEEAARSDRTLDHRLSDTESAGYWLLKVDEEPVSLAGFGGQTPNGIRVSAVYTRPQYRRQGFATTLVAALTEHLLTERRFCFLYTDLSNPTSNAIYERIGYRRVCESTEYAFVR